MSFFAIGNEELERFPSVTVGDLIRCPKCGREHTLVRGENRTDDLVLLYRCRGGVYLGAVDGKSIVDYRPREDEGCLR